ncbi:MAG: alpha/beta hydrolase [Eubacteriales bacterium]|nr:alpha/beta hydrolase [Eubacteriales bacterium]
MEPTKIGYFDTPVCQPVNHQGNDCGILLMHGFTGSPAHMRKLADGLVEKGYTVKSIVLPGHATVEEDMRKVGWEKWLQAAKEAAMQLMEQCATTTVCGLSMGGVLALLVAEQMKVNACVPISAPMATQNRFLPLSRIVAPIYKRVSWVDHPERKQLLDQSYDYGYTGFPTASGQDLYHLIRLARKNLFNINCPLLCVQSDGDETIWPGSADCILNGISSEKKWKLQLHEVPHVCTISKESPAILDGIIRVLEEARQEK